MDIADSLAGERTNPVVMVFTDGEPTGGEVEALRERLSVPHKFTVSTFGYGPEVKSELMQQLAEVGDGVYGYCPLPG
jgi:hypothetical protein